jgi:hypothetical protein
MRYEIVDLVDHKNIYVDSIPTQCYIRPCLDPKFLRF